MPDISIHNETEYDLTRSILDQIKRDALEYFGESVRAIRIQYGIDRHAYNAKTGEMRYAFSPGDFGLVDTTLTFPEAYLSRDIPSINDDAEEDLDEAVYDDDDDDDGDDGVDETTTSLESLGEDLDDVVDDEPAGFPGLGNQFDVYEDNGDDDEVAYDDGDDDEDEDYD